MLNPLGLFYVIASALPSTLGANAGLLSMPSAMPGLIRRWGEGEEERVQPIQRSIAWIATAVVASLLFVFVLARGLTWSR